MRKRSLACGRSCTCACSTPFLTLNEKRAAAGFAPLDGGDTVDGIGSAAPVGKFNPFHDSAGRFTFGPAGGPGVPDGTPVEPAGKKPTATDPPPRPASAYKKKRSGLTGKEAASDKPSWVTEGPLVGETSEAFAERVLDQHCNRQGGHDKGAGSEFSRIKKWAARAFE